MLKKMVLLQQSEAWRCITSYHVFIALNSDIRIFKNAWAYYRFLDAANHVLALRLLLITGFCSSGRVVPQILIFCLLSTLFIQKMHSSEKQKFLIGDQSIRPGLMSSVSQDPCSFSYHLKPRLQHFEARTDKKRGSHRKMRCIIEEESCTVHAALRTLRLKLLLKKSVVFYFFFSCSRSTVTTTKRKVSSIQNGSLPLKSIRGVWKKLLQSSTNPLLSGCSSLGFVVS